MMILASYLGSLNEFKKFLEQNEKGGNQSSSLPYDAPAYSMIDEIYCAGARGFSPFEVS